MIRVAVTGACGKMGILLIDNILSANDLELVAAFDIVNIGDDVGDVNRFEHLDILISDPADMVSVIENTNTDVVIDFTIAAASAENIIKVAKAGANLVVGTTGFTEDQITMIHRTIKDKKISAIISPNFAVGVNVFWKLLEEAAGYLGDFDIEIIEAHHNQKKDAPSGTAVKAAEVINKVVGGRDLIYGRQGLSPRGDEIGIHAIRGGDVVGDHTVLFFGDGERVEIRHQAHSRQAFAGGAINTLRWLMSQPPGIYSMADFLNL
ncbi:MAG: 4-hydroxy-tetrahydrodipicolinate reductase [Methanosarcinales archaeon]|nr:4-hydroxy-tetrahydrodipicolinate reductase [Methanosarcinales archaeon]